ncbi:hypothetical protein EE612_025385 [Oryza sativa]|nr:hypothetical protein EE612_025385 [Oryza sativa]
MSMSILAKRYEVLDLNADPITRSSVSAIVWSPLLSLSSCVWPNSTSSWSVMSPPPVTGVAAASSAEANRQARRWCALAGAMASGRWCKL